MPMRTIIPMQIAEPMRPATEVTASIPGQAGGASFFVGSFPSGLKR
jgi:hypothetical protein